MVKRKTSRTSRTRRTRRTRKRCRRTNKRRGGAAIDMSFKSIKELASYLANNESWMDRAYVYTKKGYNNNERSIYQYEKKDFSKLLELDGNIDEYEFQFV
jgi:hypothetical protein